MLNHSWKRTHRLTRFFGGFGRPAANTTDFLDNLLTGRVPDIREFLADGRYVLAVTYVENESIDDVEDEGEIGSSIDTTRDARCSANPFSAASTEGNDIILVKGSCEDNEGKVRSVLIERCVAGRRLKEG